MQRTAPRRSGTLRWKQLFMDSKNLVHKKSNGTLLTSERPIEYLTQLFWIIAPWVFGMHHSGYAYSNTRSIEFYGNVFFHGSLKISKNWMKQKRKPARIFRALIISPRWIQWLIFKNVFPMTARSKSMVPWTSNLWELAEMNFQMNESIWLRIVMTTGNFVPYQRNEILAIFFRMKSLLEKLTKAC